VHIHTLRRAVPAALAAAGLLLGATACGGGSDVDKGALVNKIKSDQAFSPGLTDPQANCVADVVIKYIDSGDINTYIKDGKQLPDPKKDEDKATAEMQGCTKK
jgi:hypothetical protein